MTTNDDFNADSRVNQVTTKAASTAKDRIDAASAGADRVLNAASGKLDDLRTNAAPALKQGIDQAKSWVDDKVVRVQDRVQATRDTANDLTNQVVDYTRQEPVKALLIAAAVGAGLVGLLGLIARARD